MMAPHPRLCGACHKLEDCSCTLLQKEADGEVAFKAHTFGATWRCAECEASNEPLQDFQVAEKADERVREYMDKFMEEKINCPAEIWSHRPLKGDDKTLLDHIEEGRQVLRMVLNPEQIDREPLCEMFSRDDLPAISLIGKENNDPVLSATDSAYKAFVRYELTRFCKHPSVRAVRRYCMKQPKDMVIMVFMPLFVEYKHGGTALLVGESIFVDILGELDPSLHVEARKVGFMSHLGEYVLHRYDSPRGREKICVDLFTLFKIQRTFHLNCPCCCPTKQSRREARRNAFDSSTASISTLLGHRTDTFHKIWHVDLFWPECLPEDRAKNLDWLQDSEERMSVMEEIIGEPRAQRYGHLTLNDYIWGLQCLERTLECVTGGDASSPIHDLLTRQVEALAPNEYTLVVHYVVMGTSNGIVMKNGTFRQPEIIFDNDTFEFWLDLKKCAHCGAEEEVTRTFPPCSRCKQEWYCCRDHQVAHWKTHKQVCVKKEEKPKKK